MPTHKTSTKPWELVLSSRAETESLGRAIGRTAKGGEVLALIGALGAGKTALVRGLAAGLAAPVSKVSSPTFVLVHEYPGGKFPLFHVDLYRLHSESDVENIGLQDCFSDQSVTAIEWADRFPHVIPHDRLEISLAHLTPDTRTARVRAQGPHSLNLLAGLKRGWHASHRRRRTNRTNQRGASSR